MTAATSIPEADAPPGRVHPVLSGAIARLASFVPTAIATFLASRLIIEHFGRVAFNGFTLAISLIALVPLNDLGVGAAVSSAFASRGPKDPEVERVVLTAARVVAGSALVLAAVSSLLVIGGTWQTILGPSVDGGTFFAISMVIYAVSFVPALSQAILLGVHKNHFTILVQTLFTPTTLGFVLLLIAVDADPRWLVPVPAAALLLNNLLASTVATRVTGFRWLPLIGKLTQRSKHAGASIRGIAGPRLIVSVTMPLALASDRIVLSHVASPSDLTNYAVCMQIFAPVSALIAASAQPLWPIYVAARSKGQRGPQMLKVVVAFVGITTVVVGALIAISPQVGHLIGTEKVDLGYLLPGAAGLCMLVAAATFPISTALTTPTDLKFVAKLSLLALPANVGLSIVLAEHIGAAGPLFGSAFVALFLQTLPCAVYLRRHPHEVTAGTDLPAPDEVGEAVAEAAAPVAVALMQGPSPIVAPAPVRPPDRSVNGWTVGGPH